MNEVAARSIHVRHFCNVFVIMCLLSYLAKTFTLFRYMCPYELKDGERTAKGDVFALGIVLFECLTCSVPSSSSAEIEF